MKKIFLSTFLICALCLMHCAFSQNPLVKMWDKRFGGDTIDYLTSFRATLDRGYILGGFSFSGISGDKTQARWGERDYWIVKIDSIGNKQWDKDFGGTGSNALFSLEQTKDLGYILGGYSNSGISGNKTTPLWVGAGADYWIVKTDSLGNIQWDKDFGGTDHEQLNSLQQTSDGGYILGGYSISGISGNKTQMTWNSTYDYWIIKIDSLGNKQWDKDFGGTSWDYLYYLQQTTDGGYILGGSSTSGISGDKTQPTWGGITDYDFWIIKIDSIGNKQWDKDYGGTEDDELSSLQQTSDGGYILAGHSYSGVSGDKTQPAWSTGYVDYWIVKIDSVGNKEWDKDFGGTDGEELYKVSQIQDGGYLISGDSYSSISGDKTENNLGFEQTWIIKTDALGNKQWDKTVLTSGHDETGLAIQTSDGCYTIANWSNGGIAGYKTQTPWNNSYDYWIVKFCDSTLLPTAAAAVASLICPGTCTDFTNLSVNATSYQWSFPGATPDTSTDVNPQNICYANTGSYDVQLIASNSNGSDTLLLANYITVYPTPAPQAITQSGDTLFAIAGASTYQWYYNGNAINGATGYFYVASASGDYNVVATDANGCEVEAGIFNVVAGLPSSALSLLFSVFPNPVLDKITIQKLEVTSETAIEISIYNVLGEKVMGVSLPSILSSQSSELDVHALATGMYYLEVVGGPKTFRNKFTKQ